MKIILIIFLSIIYATNTYSDLNHRGGCENDYYHKIMLLPENSLICLEAGLVGIGGGEMLQDSEMFEYLEFDVRETKDHEIVVYHGGSKGRIFGKDGPASTSNAMIPYSAYNKAVYESFNIGISWKKVRVKDVTLEQISQFKLYGEYDQFVPSLQEYLQATITFGLRRPLMVELKDIYSIDGRDKLLQIVSSYKQNFINLVDINLVANPKKEFDFQKVGFMARTTKAKSIMGKVGSASFLNWCNMFKQYGFPGIYKTTKSKKNYCPK